VPVVRARREERATVGHSRLAGRVSFAILVLGAPLLLGSTAHAWHNPSPPDCDSCTTASQCDDKNACTTDACVDGKCVSTPIPGCAPCDTPLDCKDGNPCTAELCTAGVCSNPPMEGCVRCETATDCDDGNACTTDSCVGRGVCAHMLVGDCTPCGADADCNDGAACTADVCTDGVCGNPPIADCTPCAGDGDCNDTNACTTDACTDGACTATPIAGCMLCTSEGDCSDGNGCTVDSCGEAGTCVHTPVSECVPCATAADCADGDPCTGDVCDASGVCTHRAKTDCTPCETAGDCDDGNPCSKDECAADGSCAITFIPGCVLCESDAACDDEVACTEDTCIARVCTHTHPEECCEGKTEVCGDGVDNDCDGRTDCEDENCAASPACDSKTEICGNCVDDDGNGLTDFEDPACCPRLLTFPMNLKRGRIRDQGPTSRVRLRSALTRTAPMDVNPRKQDVFVQLRPEEGTDLLCARIPAAKFMGKHRKYKFWDKKRMIRSAKGLTDMTIKIKKNGVVKFRTKGRRTEMAAARPGMLQVTVGFLDPRGDAENRCSSTMRSFRLGPRGKLQTP
jgi:Dictyostelium (slime mold) repeat